jgi:hypothetical protein
MNMHEAVEEACKQPTLVDALSWIAVWECERAIAQAKKFFETGRRTGDGKCWDTCFKYCIQHVMVAYSNRERMYLEKDEILEDVIKKLPQLPQVQYSTAAQLDYLRRIAIKYGLYDAADVLQNLGRSTTSYHRNLPTW